MLAATSICLRTGQSALMLIQGDRSRGWWLISMHFVCIAARRGQKWADVSRLLVAHKTSRSYLRSIRSIGITSVRVPPNDSCYQSRTTSAAMRTLPSIQLACLAVSFAVQVQANSFLTNIFRVLSNKNNVCMRCGAILQASGC
jgi:hypothetical protein